MAQANHFLHIISIFSYGINRFLPLNEGKCVFLACFKKHTQCLLSIHNLCLFFYCPSCGIFCGTSPHFHCCSTRSPTRLYSLLSLFNHCCKLFWLSAYSEKSIVFSLSSLMVYAGLWLPIRTSFRIPMSRSHCVCTLTLYAVGCRETYAYRAH